MLDSYSQADQIGFRVGLNVLDGFIGAALFFAIDAGTKLLGK